MTKTRNFLFIAVMLVLLISSVSAGTIEVNVQTLKDHTLNVNFLNPERGAEGEVVSYGSVTKSTGTGQMSFTFSSTASAFDIDVFLMQGKNVLAHETFEGIKNNQKILIVLVPGVIGEITENYNPSASTQTALSSSTSSNLQDSTSPGSSQSSQTTNNQDNQSTALGSSSKNSSSNAQNPPESSQQITPEQEDSKTMNSFFESRIFPFVLGSLVILIVLLGLAFIYKILFKKLKKQLEKEMEEKVVLKDPLVSLEKKLKGALKDLEDLKRERARNQNLQRNLRKDIEEKKKIIQEIKFAKRKLAQDKQRLNNLRNKLRQGKEDKGNKEKNNDKSFEED